MDSQLNSTDGTWWRIKGSSSLWTWIRASAAVSAAILLILRPLQMVVCTQEISVLSKCNRLYQWPNPMCCHYTDSTLIVRWQMLQISWEQSHIHYTFSHIYWIFFEERTNKQFSSLPCLHPCLLGLKSECIRDLKIWDLFWHMTIVYEP